MNWVKAIEWCITLAVLGEICIIAGVIAMGIWNQYPHATMIGYWCVVSGVVFHIAAFILGSLE